MGIAYLKEHFKDHRNLKTRFLIVERKHLKFRYFLVFICDDSNNLSVERWKIYVHKIMVSWKLVRLSHVKIGMDLREFV